MFRYIGLDGGGGPGDDELTFIRVGGEPYLLSSSRDLDLQEILVAVRTILANLVSPG